MSATRTGIDHSALDAALANLRDAPHWYIAYSGGVDSSALLHLVQQWALAHPGAPPVTALHVHHGLQAEADQWQRHCDQFCHALGLPMITRRTDVQCTGRGTEAAARQARYGVFEEVLEAGDVLFLGHHLDDQVETFFLRLLRGAGVHGLAAMPQRRPLGKGVLLRPLLALTREQLERYAASHGLQWVADPSNADTSLDRNFLRANVLPLLASRWPGYRQTVERASAHMAATVSALESALPNPATCYTVVGDPGVDVAPLLAATEETAAIGLRQWLQQGRRLAPDQALLAEFLRQLRDSAKDRNPRLDCGKYVLQRYRDAVYLLPESAAPTALRPIMLPPGEWRDVPGVGRVALERTRGAGLLLAADEPLRLDWRRGGEQCRPQGRHSGSLKKLLQEAAVPPWWRDRLPLLYLGDELLAVGGLWLCESSRWRPSAMPGEILWALRWSAATAVSGD